MHRALWDKKDRNDDGMTVVEVVFALAILLLGLTALLGMLMTSTGMSARARAQGLAVKTASQFIEKVRATDYSTLNQAKLNELAAASSGTVGGMTTSVTTSMTPHYEASQATSSIPAFQAIKVLVVVSGPGFKSFRFRTGTYVREWKRSAAASRTAPTVRFDNLTPPAGTPVRPIWGSVHVGAAAVSNMPGVVLTSVNVMWGNSYLASATLDAATGSCANPSWNTIGLNAEGRKVTLFAQTWDTLNQSDTNSRDFIIDNIRPPAPSAVTFTSITGNSTATWAWPVVMDGESPAPDYVLTLNKKDSIGAWIGTVHAPVTAVSASLATVPFSQYYPFVVARGPRAVAGLTADWVSPATAGPVLTTRPSFSAMNVTVTERNNKPFIFTATSLGLTPPTFPVTSPSYRWEYKLGSGAWTSFASAASPNTNPSTATAVSYANVTGPNGPQNLAFRCTATVTIGGVVTVVKSPIMTRIATSAGTYTLASFTPDWATSW